MTSKPKIKIAWSIDFDAVSGWLGTGQNDKNTTSDYSSGYFSATTGVPRLLKLFKKLDIADKVTWCIPGHSIETFPEQTKAIVASGAEIALHGYAHEAASQMTAEQEEDVLKKCISLVEGLTGAKPVGYRAPLYQLQERTISLLQRYGFLWDSSLSHFDSVPYLLPKDPAPLGKIDFKPEANAVDWMVPSPNFTEMPKSSLVEIPANWYAEDMTPLQFFPNVPNSAGYVDVRVVENMWKDRFEWLRTEIADGRNDTVIFSIIIHPDTSGMAHVIGMVERFLKWLQSFGDEVEFLTYKQIAEEWRASQK
ncbi:Putative NodB domain, glycoside hydrolase/deacetylase, beta/alpha-barrel [Septoria linicola]|uniref:NodB domain, glycoside hydrolase/deacetylase, beta/alpha-barrel n=1 Tax=Septoria linicola TaxID=215465 RepID=A0A9Q9EP51_9PEZI|nr:putative NodB domain, glycoside hydrolase/deacetylase, beta/alpha-barrel [Septoria linicola]USW58456.1 Putative NodB domain, glycoside hydrolase/deacetylase, beta/alpha-barrel [Septoria linicola]